MKELLNKTKNNFLIKKILYIGIVFFLFAYSFSIPSFSGRPVFYIISYFLMAALSVCTILYTFLYTSFSFNKWLILPISFVGFALIGTIFYSHSFIGITGRIGWTSLVLMLITLAVFYYSFVAINNKRFIALIFVSSFIAFAFYFLVIYRHKIFHFDLSQARLGGYFDNVNTVGFYFAIGSVLSLFLALFYKKKIELLYLLPAILFIVLGLFTGSRSFVVSILTGFVLFLRFRKHKFIFLVLLGIFIGLFFVMINIPQLSFLKDQFDRALYTIFGIGNSKIETSTVQRFVWPKYAFYLSGKNMLFGYGVNGFAIYAGVGTYAHNNFAEVMCNFGIIGFILYYASFFVPFVLSFKPKEEEVYLVPIFVVVYFFRSFFGVTYYAKESYLIIALCLFLTKDCKLPIFKFGSKKEGNHENCYEVSI